MLYITRHPYLLVLNIIYSTCYYYKLLVYNICIKLLYYSQDVIALIVQTIFWPIIIIIWLSKPQHKKEDKSKKKKTQQTGPTTIFPIKPEISAYPETWIVLSSYRIYMTYICLFGMKSCYTALRAMRGIRDWVLRSTSFIMNVLMALPPPEPPPCTSRKKDDTSSGNNTESSVKSDVTDTDEGKSSNTTMKVSFETNKILRSAATLQFDTDAVLLFKDSCVTDGMTPSKADYIPGTYTPLTCMDSYLGSGGTGAICGYGTAQYHVKDDMGQQCTITVPGMAYSPTVPHRLLAPQYLQKVERQAREKDSSIFHSATGKTGTYTEETISTLTFNHGMNVTTITHLPGARVPALYVNVGV